MSVTDKSLRKRAQEEKRAQEGIHSEGRKLLVEWLATNGYSQGTVAAKLDVSTVAVNAWVNGRARPSAPLRVPLELLTGIPASSWETDEDVARREEALRRVLGEKVAS